MNTELLRAALADRYAIERELGRGGMAVVYLAHDGKHDRKVALKVIQPDLAESVKAERFLREIQIAAKLSHPHILPLYDSGAVDGVLYYVMPYVEGESLRDRLHREKQLPLDDALRITRDVASALGEAHEQGVVHRDIKPENILLTKSGHAVVADFGIARALTVADGRTVTETGLAVGTPAYMSPEQGAGSGELDGRSDIYSLGCVLYEMLAGHPPFAGETAQEILTRHALDSVPSLRAARPGVPRAVERAVAKALAKVPADRFATPAEFAGALAGPRRRLPVYAALGVLVLAAGGVVARQTLFRPPAAQSVAVLPFVNLSRDTGDEYFSDGMTDDLINALTQVAGLRVPARTSAFSFKGKTVAMAEVGRLLSVATVLEGTVRRAGDQLRVTAQLVQASDGHNLWSHQYDRVLRDAKDVFAIQDDISRAIVSALEVKLTAAAPVRPENLEAYELYLKGRLFWNRGTEEALTRAREYFSAAIAQDSGYARAYAGLADVYEQLEYLRYLPRAEAYPKARAAAERAVALDSQLAEAYTSRGQIRYHHEWDWLGAERDFRRAVALNPGYALGHVWYGRFLSDQGRSTEAIREARRAAELDPLSAQVLLISSQVLSGVRQYERALEQARKALDLEPSAQGHQRLATVYLWQNKFADAIREFQTALGLLGGRGRVGVVLARLGYTYARAGRRDEALKILEDMKRRVASGDKALIGHEIHLANLYTGLGDKDQAFAWLARAYQAHDFGLANLRVEAFFDPLRSDVRFKELLKKMGLEP